MAKVTYKDSLPSNSTPESKKIDLVAITPEMSKEEITINLLKMFERQGIKVKGKKFKETGKGVEKDAKQRK